MNTRDRSFAVADDAYLCRAILSAEKRLVVVAPALNAKVANTLCEQWRRLGGSNVSVILDLDPEVFRLGYG